MSLSGPEADAASTGAGANGVTRPAAAAEDPTVASPPVSTEVKPGWRVRLFGSDKYFRLWLAQVVSSIGDWMGFLAIAAAAFRLGGAGSSATAVGLVMSARIAPGFFLAPVAGVLVDRWDRKKLMIACDLGRAGTLALLPFVSALWQLLIASLLLEIFTLLWSPAKEASVPNLVPADRLTTVNSLSLVAAYGTFPFASALFAFLAKVAEWLARFDALESLRVNQESVAFWFDSATFAFSALMISFLALPQLSRHQRMAEHVDGKRASWSQTVAELKEGWRAIFINPVVRAVNVGLATGLIGGGMLVPLGPVFSKEVLGAGTAGFGLLTTALGVGVALGVLALSIMQKRLPKARVFTTAVLGAGLSLLSAASVSSLPLAMAAVTVMGVCAGAVYVIGFTILHENVGDDMRGRIFAALFTLVRLCVLIAFAIGPLLTGLLDELSQSLFDDSRVSLGSVDVFVPGVRLSLWLAGLIILGAWVLAVKSIRSGDPPPPASSSPPPASSSPS